MAASRDCKILRPVLVAIVYGEPHPERARFLAHVRKCVRCRTELEELREVEGWISESSRLESRGLRSATRSRSRPSALLSRVATAAIVLLVATLIFSGSRGRREPRPAEVASSGAGAGVATRLAARPSRPSGVFGVDGVDLGIDSVRARILALQGDGW